MKEISLKGELGAGKVVLVDDDDYEWLSQYSFTLNDERRRKDKPRNYFYVQTRITKGGPTVSIHQLIMGKAPKGYKIDHIDRNTLNNQKNNLKFVSNSESNHNKTPRGASAYRGLWLDRRDQKWQVSISKNSAKYSLGFFADPVEAAQNYDFYALLLYGSQASLNFPNFDYSTFTPKRHPDAVLRNSKELLCSSS